MALLRFVQRNYGLPNPKGSLSSEVPAAAIARATHEVQAESWRYTSNRGDETCIPSLQRQRLGSNAHHTAHAHGAVGCMKQWCGKHKTTLYWTVTFNLHGLNVSLSVLIISSAV